MASWHVQPFFSKQPRPVRSTEVASAKPDVKAALSNTALAFEPNKGQTDPRVKYLSRGSGYAVFLTENEAVIRLKRTKAEKSAVVAMKFGQTPKSIVAESRQEGHTNYFVGPQSRWLTNIPNYSQVRYTEVFPGVDAKFYGDGTRLRYDLIVNKGADPSKIALEFKGGNKLSLDKKGNLLLSTDSGDVIYEKPYLYQEVAGVKKTVEGGYRILDNEKVGFEIGAYNAGETLVIDPTVAFSSYLGGTLADQVNAVAHDVNRAYAAGQTLSPDFPVNAAGTNGSAVFPKDAITDVFVVALNNIGTTRVWTTYFGGTLTDIAKAMVHSGTLLLVVGDTTSKDLAGTPPNPGTGPLGQDQDAFWAAFDPATGNRLASQYLGGQSNDFANAVALSGTFAVIVGTTSSAPGPTSFAQITGFDTTLGGTQDAFAVLLDLTTGTYGPGTYIGGDGVENGNGVVIPAGGPIIIVGDSTSTNSTGLASLPTGTNNLQANNGGGTDGLVVAMADPTVAPTQVSYVGGSGTDSLTAATWNVAQNLAVIAGNTTSSNLAVTSGAAQGTLQGGQDGFVAQFPLAPTPLRYTYLTYLGGAGADSITAIGRDITEQVYVVGSTASSNFPVVRAVQTTLSGGTDGFVSRLAADGKSINNSTFFGGSGNDAIQALSLDPLQKALYFGGWTDGGGIPTSFAAYRPTPVGARDGFLTNWVFNDLTVTPNNPTFTLAFGASSTSQVLSLNWTNQINPYSLSSVTYGGPTAPGTACTGWLTVSQQGASAIQVTVNPTGAGCSGPGTAFTGTFTVDGGGDNGPQTVVVTLNLTSTTTPPAGFVRYFEKGTNFVTTNGPNPATPTNVTNNTETVNISSTPSALPYTATIAFTGVHAPCAGAITVQASGTTGTSPNFAITYVKSVLDAVNLSTLPLFGTSPACQGTVTFVVPGTTPNQTMPIVIAFTSRLQVVSASGLTETFNFVNNASPAATRTAQVRGDDVDVLFTAAVTGTLTAATGPGTCPAGALTVAPGPFIATSDLGFLNPADVNISVDPAGCTNMTQYVGEVTLTPSDPTAGGDPIKIRVNANVGNALLVNVTLPAGIAMGSATPNPLGTSIATDTLPSTPYTRTVNVTTAGPAPAFGPVSFNVLLSTAVVGAYGGSGNPTPQNAASATGWLRVAPASGTASSTTPAVLTVTVDPTIWAGLAASAGGTTYTGVITLRDTATSNAVPDVLIPVTFVKYTQPLVVAPTTLAFAGQVGAGIIAPQTVNVRLATGWASVPPDFTVDVLTASGPGNYPGYGYPADASGGAFTGGQNAASWLTVTPTSGATTVGAPGANVTVQANVTNLTVGTYTGVIRFRHSNNTATSFSGMNPVTVAVTFVVTSAIPPPPTGGLQFVSINPCRIMDSRGNGFTGSFGPPSLVAGGIRTVPVPSSTCAIPVTARAYSVNITAVPKTGSLGFLTVWPTGQVQPGVSTLNSPDGQIVANGAIIPAGVGGAIDTYVTNDTDLVIDINGYFVPPATGTLQFYSVTPCRAADTRLAGQTPALAANTPRSFTIAGTCGIPTSAVAVSLNATIVPVANAAIGYLTLWPTGATQPFVSTTNSLDGSIRSNNAIIPLGTGGAISAFAALNSTELVIDVNGYYAAPATGGLNFFSVAPCRASDTRNPNGPFGGPIMGAGTSRTFAIATSGCGLPATAKAYSTNLTVVPTGPLGYLTAYPTGVAAPFVSNLNSPKGIVVANGAVVPSGTAGAIDIFVLNETHVIIDTNGYFQ